MGELTAFLKVVEIVAQLGVAGLILVLWYLTDRSKAKLIEAYRADMQETLEQYKADMEETRRMYENNAELVRGYESMAKDLKDVVMVNTQMMSTLAEEIRTNQYCPAVRIDEEKKGKRK